MSTNVRMQSMKIIGGLKGKKNEKNFSKNQGYVGK